MTYRILTGLLIGLLILSCNHSEKKLFLNKQIDLKNYFSVNIPDNWSIENDTTNFLSAIFFSDTSKTIQNTIVYNVICDSAEIHINEHFALMMDTITLNYGLEKRNGIFSNINEFQTYQFDISGFDPLNEIGYIETHHYMKIRNKKGHLTFTVRRNKLELTKQDSILTKNILNSITRN